MIKDYFILALKNLRRRGLRSWLTLLGIFIGVLTVIALISIGDGLKMAVNSQFGVETTQMITIQAGGLNSYGPPGSGVVNSLTKDDAIAISKLSNIELVIPRLIKTVKIETSNQLKVGYAASLPEDNLAQAYEIQNIEVETGRLLEKADTSKILLGHQFSIKEKSGLNKAFSPGDTLQINGKNFRVAGILEKKGSFILDGAIFMSESDMRDLLNIKEDVSLIAAKVKSKDLMDEAKEDIEKLLRERRDVKKGEEDFEVSTPEASLKTVNQILGAVQAFFVLIAFASIIVGIIGIINTMTTSVLERRKEVGIMKAIGARNSQIFLQFFIEAGLLGLIGGIFGVIFGIIVGSIGIIAINNFLGSTNLPQINFFLIFATLLFSFIIGALSGIIPAIRAARQNIIEVLRV
jgi:putative ABC transport system permease protein